MPGLKVLSAKDLLKVFEKFGFVVASQRGSHIKMKRVLATGKSQILTVPANKELPKGTTRAIYRQATRYISEEKLRSYFYND